MAVFGHQNPTECRFNFWGVLERLNINKELHNPFEIKGFVFQPLSSSTYQKIKNFKNNGHFWKNTKMTPTKFTDKNYGD